MSQDLFQNSSERLLPTNVVAQKLQKSERTVRWYAETGRIPAIRDGVKLWKFRRDDIDTFKRDHNQLSVEVVRS